MFSYCFCPFNCIISYSRSLKDGKYIFKIFIIYRNGAAEQTNYNFFPHLRKPGLRANHIAMKAKYRQSGRKSAMECNKIEFEIANKPNGEIIKIGINVQFLIVYVGLAKYTKTT